MDFSKPVQLAWLVPVLPLVALILNFLVFRMIEVAGRPKAPAVAGPQGHDDHSADAPAAPAPADEHDSGGGHGHGGTTPFWAQVVSLVALGAMVLAFALSVAIALEFNGDPGLQQRGVDLHLYEWFHFGSLTYNIDFHVDALTAVMLIVVTGVSMLVHLYSIGYMAGDPGYSRFFIELSLFTFSMLLLVLGANFLVLFIGWELVGLSSYLLIGFFFNASPPPAGSEVPYPPPAQLKAFVTTRVGDFGFLIGILILWVTTGTFTFTNLNTLHDHPTTATQAMVTIAMILVFCGAVGKSAQFPLHVWLPDAMAGPTPVSALIHAATMVAAGVYLVARLFPLYAEFAGPQSLMVVGGIGTFTAIFAATIALTQNDIKGVLAYSTISQLGYMFAGLAVAEHNNVGIFHLFTHAFFKALLFLGSGSVIHAIGAQDLRKMGGLAKWLPVTAGTFLIANLAISGIPPFSGFFSKDLILETAYTRGHYLIYGVLLFTAFLTAFYMFRLFFMAFGGRGSAWAGFWGNGQNYRGEGHPHESPWVMTFPLIVLAFMSIVAGFFSLGNGFSQYLTGGAIVEPYQSPFVNPLTWISVAAGLLGIALAWGMYGLEVVSPKLFTENPVTRPVYLLLKNHYYIDELYGAGIKYGVLGISKGFELFDKYVIDGVANGIGSLTRGIGKVTSRSETGFVQNYGAALFGGALVLMIALFVVVSAIGH
ncbi:MAG TPA: NADH-quinone oxidoreductase subunit L [Ktedonobacterales bacterium]